MSGRSGDGRWGSFCIGGDNPVEVGDSIPDRCWGSLRSDVSGAYIARGWTGCTGRLGRVPTGPLLLCGTLWSPDARAFWREAPIGASREARTALRPSVDFFSEPRRREKIRSEVYPCRRALGDSTGGKGRRRRAKLSSLNVRAFSISARWKNGFGGVGARHGGRAVVKISPLGFTFVWLSVFVSVFHGIWDG